MDATRKWKVIKKRSEESEQMEDTVAEERRVRISVNGKELLSLYCTPIKVRELAVGLLMSEGVAEGICTERITILYGDEVTVDVPAEGEVRTEGASVTSGCVGGVTFRKELPNTAREDDKTIEGQALRELFRRFHSRSELYSSTGCIHSAALADGGGIICFAEDIGRHNAVDKVIGEAIMESVDFGGKIMLASGRLSSEIVSKCAMWGIPIVASRTAPTALALDIAENCGITVVGFLRGDRMNIYTNPQRVV